MNPVFRPIVAVLLCGAGSAGQVCGIERASVDTNGNEVPYASVVSSVSDDGRFVLFSTQAALVPEDTNYPIVDAYLFDTRSNQLELISVGTSGLAGNWHTSFAGSISGDGRFVVFTSGASDLVAGDTFDPDAFLRDRWSGTTTIVSVKPNGGNGEATGILDFSPDGRYVVFTCAKQLVPYDTNGIEDVYVRDLQSGSVECVSVTPAGVSGPPPGGTGGLPVGISSDGRYVVFSSSVRYIAVGDTQSYSDVFCRDRWTGSTLTLSVNAAGQLGNGHSEWVACSEDGRYVVFDSVASNLVQGDTNGAEDVFLRDVQHGTIERINLSYLGFECDQGSFNPSISPDGRFVAYGSLCSFLVPGDGNSIDDVFVYDRFALRTERVLGTQLGEPDDKSAWPALSRSAGTLSFASKASNLIASDTNQQFDIFVRHCPLPAGYCTPKVNSQGCLPTLVWDGVPMLVTPSGFVLSATQVLNLKAGMLFYSTTGPASIPFQGGMLCVQAPLRRTIAQNSGGSASGSDCTGRFAFDFNAWIATGLDPTLVAGTMVWAQYWSRDPGFLPPFNSGLTNAAHFTIWP